MKNNMTFEESKRNGWSEKFKKYSEEGEDPKLLPDYLDSEAINLLDKESPVILGQTTCPNCGIQRGTDVSKCICGYNPMTGKVEQHNFPEAIKGDLSIPPKEEKELNLCELLRGHEGEKFFSLIDGEVTFVKIVDNPNISVGEKPIVTSEGRYLPNAMYQDRGVPTLFPSLSLYEKYPLDAKKAWQEWSQERMPKRWRAQRYEKYWYLDRRFIPKNCIAGPNESFDNTNYENGNYFRTKEEAEQAAVVVRKVLQKIHNEQSK